MKINDSSTHINFEAYAQKVKEAGGSHQEKTTVDAGATAAVDKVVLSPKAREIQEAHQLLGDIPDVDASKVDHIRLQIDKGVYKVDGKQIAERMMREMSANQMV
jgi:flagellar biosynthesis anti-sigma factor FlgM